MLEGRNNPRNRFKGPIPSAETVANYQNVFGLTTPKQPHLIVQQHHIHDVQFPSSTLFGVKKQTPADSRNCVLYDGALVQSEASFPWAQSECDVLGFLQSFFLELLLVAILVEGEAGITGYL